MVSYSAKLDSRTKQHTQFGVSASNGSRDMARTKVAGKKKKKMNVDDSIKHPLLGSLIIIRVIIIITLIIMIIIITRQVLGRPVCDRGVIPQR